MDNHTDIGLLRAKAEDGWRGFSTLDGGASPHTAAGQSSLLFCVSLI